MSTSRCWRLGSVAAACAVAACLPADPPPQRSSAIVHDLDDRREYFEVVDTDAAATLARSMVAFLPASSITEAGEISAPSYGSTAGLCPGEPFAAQPAAAFCSGVLVDWDLVLTAGHCLRLFALDDLRVVFGYYHEAPGTLSVSVADVFPVAEVVAEALDPSGVQPRLDYAWVRLGRRVSPPRRPAAVHAAAPPVGVGTPVVSIGTPGGTPAKIDTGGQVRTVREEWFDYFVADTDTSAGASGGAAFDENGALLGVLARGGDDFVPHPDLDCNLTNRAARESADEQFTYAHRALQGLCAKRPDASSLCRAACQGVCEALPPASDDSIAAGCAVVPLRPGEAPGPWAILILMVGALALARGQRPAARAGRRRSEVAPPTARTRAHAPGRGLSRGDARRAGVQRRATDSLVGRIVG